MPKDIFYIGSSALGLKHLLKSDLFSVLKIFCLKNRITNSLEEVAIKAGLSIEYFDWIADFRDLVRKQSRDIPFFIYQLDMLVPMDLVEEYSFFNVHRGSLYTNRGPNPDVWPILLGHPHTVLSLHRINDKIDSGQLIATYEVPILADDDTKSVKNKLEKGLPYLITTLNDYLDGKIESKPLSGGDYYPWITEKDFTIDFCKDSLENIDRKIRSQRQYNGAILWIDNKKKYVVEIEEIIENRGPCGKAYIQGDIVKVHHGDTLLCLKLNNSPKYPSPPLFPKSKRI